MRGLLTTGVALAALVLPGIALAQDAETPPAEMEKASEVVTGDAPQPMPTDMPIAD